MNGVMNGGTRSLRLVWDGPFTLVNARGGHWSNHAAENATLRRWAEMTGTDQGVVFGGPVTIEALMTVHRGVLPDCDAIAGGSQTRHRRDRGRRRDPRRFAEACPVDHLSRTETVGFDGGWSCS